MVNEALALTLIFKVNGVRKGVLADTDFVNLNY